MTKYEPSACEARRKRGGERDEAGVGIGRVDKLRGLGDVFRGHDARLEGFVETEALSAATAARP